MLFKTAKNPSKIKKNFKSNFKSKINNNSEDVKRKPVEFKICSGTKVMTLIYKLNKCNNLEMFLERIYKMKWTEKICKYLLCVGLAMILIMFFSLLLYLQNNNQLSIKGLLICNNGVVDIPIYFGLGWVFYQMIVKKIYENNLNYYWMLVKVTLQGSSITFILLFIMIKLEELYMLWY